MKLIIVVYEHLNHKPNFFLKYTVLFNFIIKLWQKDDFARIYWFQLSNLPEGSKTSYNEPNLSKS